MSIITLPGSIPGLLRRGSPALVSLHLKARAVTIHGIRDGLAWFASDGCDTVVVASISVLALDLTDATGRAHAAWWLANRLHPDDGPYLTAAVVPGRVLGPLRFGLSTISVMEGERWRVFDELGTEDLDPLGDDRLLPDGSRWVDAEALRRVVLHVAGVTP